MSAELETHSEIVKLARLLDADPQDIDYLAEVSPEALRNLRRSLLDRFYGGTDEGIQRFAKIGNLLPAKVIAQLTKEAVGPVMAARIAGLIDPKQAAAVVGNLSPSFVAEIATHIDPRRVEPVIGRLPDDQVIKIAQKLIDRKEFVTMGQLASFVSDEILNAAFVYASDDALLQVAFVTEDKTRLSDALKPQSDERITNIIRTAVFTNLWPEAVDLLTQLSDEQYLRVINLASKLDKKTMDKLVGSTIEPILWQVMVPALAQMDDPSEAVHALLRGSNESIKGFAQTVVGDGAWQDARELIEKLDEPTRQDFRAMLGKYKLVTQFEPVAELLAA